MAAKMIETCNDCGTAHDRRWCCPEVCSECGYVGHNFDQGGMDAGYQFCNECMSIVAVKLAKPKRRAVTYKPVEMFDETR